MILFLIMNIFIHCSEYLNPNKFVVQQTSNENVTNIQQTSFNLLNASTYKNVEKEYLSFLDGSNTSVTNDETLNIDVYNHEDTLIHNDDYSDYLRFLDNITWESSDEEKIANNGNIIPIKFKEYLKQIYDSTCNYINSNLNKNNTDNYIKRLDKIVETINIINPCGIDYNEIFTIEIDNFFKCMLNDIKLKYMNYKINNETYDVFSIELDLKIKEIEKSENYNQIQENIKNGKNPHLREFIRIYKYAKVFPEILSLGYASTQISFKKVTIYFHLIALLCEFNGENLNALRIIVMLLIKKSFSYCLKHKLDIFYMLKLQEADSKKRIGLNFFIWEFNNKIRYRIRQRINRYNDSSIYYYEDVKIHYQIVLRLFLIQHLIYLKAKNVKNYVFEEFKVFMDGVLTDEDRSYSDYFDRFIDMI